MEIITDPKRIKKISVTTTIDFGDSEDSEDLQNVCRINLEDLDFEDSDEDKDCEEDSDEDVEDSSQN